jgi:hypothetical protein
VPSPRRKKKENSGKVNCIQIKLYLNLKKRGRAESEARYRPRRYSSTPPTIGGTVPSGLTSFPKKKAKFKICIKGSRAADEDTKDKEIKQTGALTKKKTVIALTGRLQARSPADR